MKLDAMMIIDVQVGLINSHPYNENKVVGTIKETLKSCRENNIPVIYVSHDGGKGDVLEQGTPGFEIDSRIAPMEGECLFTKTKNSAFNQTGLEEYLNELGIQNIVVCGLQTEFCIDATIKSASEKGFNIVALKDGITTFDNAFLSAKALNYYYEEMIWDKRYAAIKCTDDLVYTS